MGELTKRREIRMKKAVADKRKYDHEKRIKANRTILSDSDDNSQDERMPFSNGLYYRKG
jgi:hypothetical protein